MIPLLKDGMLGFKHSQTTNFLPEESEISYQENLITQPVDWIYRTRTITYTFNTYGHRCVELEDLGDDYILFTGCSHTAGIGLNLEDTYPYIVSKHYDKPYYNLALGGTGPDIVMINLLAFLSKVKHKPKLVIIQWPDFNRFFHFDKDYGIRCYNPHQSNMIYKVLINNDIPYRHNIFHRLFVLQILKNQGITNIMENTTKTDSDTVKFEFPEWIDKARDLSHGGILTNQLRAEKVISVVDKNFAQVLKM